MLTCYKEFFSVWASFEFWNLGFIRFGIWDCGLRIADLNKVKSLILIWIAVYRSYPWGPCALRRSPFTFYPIPFCPALSHFSQSLYLTPSTFSFCPVPLALSFTPFPIFHLPHSRDSIPYFIYLTSGMHHGFCRFDALTKKKIGLRLSEIYCMLPKERIEENDHHHSG